MGNTVDMLNVATLRVRFMQLCQMPQWALAPCCKGNVPVLRSKLLGNVLAMQSGHQGLFLGEGSLTKLEDEGLYVCGGT